VPEIVRREFSNAPFRDGPSDSLAQRVPSQGGNFFEAANEDRHIVLALRILLSEFEHFADAQQRLDANSLAMRQRRETVEHPFGTMKARMGATHLKQTYD
jgi:hypothetical protein